MKPTIYIGADHAGFDLKASLKEHLAHQGFIVEDLGAHELNPTDDYPQYAGAVAEAVRNHPGSLGVLACGNAEGVCIAANKFDEIRAGVGYSVEASQTMRNDDNANVICLPGRVKTQDDPLKVLDAFVATPFSGAARHVRRLEQVAAIEERQSGQISVVPAVLVESKAEFIAKINDSELRAVAKLWQVDVLDGSMFDRTSWFDAEEIALMPLLPQIELHLMVENPLPIIETWQKSTPTLQRAIIHAEIARPIGAVLQRIREMKLEAGLAINPETSLDAIEGHASEIQVLLVMGVHPGASGRPFGGEAILAKIRQAKKRFPNLRIAVDGGITLANAPEIISAGADQLCVASALWETSERASVYQKLASL